MNDDEIKKQLLEFINRDDVQITSFECNLNYFGRKKITIELKTDQTPEEEENDRKTYLFNIPALNIGGDT